MIDQEQQRAEIHSTGTEHWGIMQRMISFTVLLITALFTFFSAGSKTAGSKVLERALR
jgi:hypothetical protein